MRIKIINTTEAPRRPADYVFHGKKVLEGKDIGRVMNQLLDDVMHEKYTNEKEILLHKAEEYR